MSGYPWKDLSLPIWNSIVDDYYKAMEELFTYYPCPKCHSWDCHVTHK